MAAFMDYNTTNATNTTVPWTITIYQRPQWTFGNEPSFYPDRGLNRQLRRLREMVQEFGKKVAEARHANILWARQLIDEQLRWLRRFGTPMLAGLHQPVQRRGRVCGESNYYRVMLC